MPPAVAVVIPAKDEAERIAETVASASTIDGVDLVVVVDDGSTDTTQHVARDAGATVVRHPRNRGKAAAMATGAAVVAARDAGAGGDAGAGCDAGVGPHVLLFVDADLGSTAVRTAALVPPVLAGSADMTIAVLPRQQSPGGGRGLVVGLARRGIAAATGWAPTQPLSGMRCLSRAAFDAAQPLARGWGVETALTIDLLRQRFSVAEVDCELHHRVTGTDLRAQLHRARQFRDVAVALARRGLWRAILASPRR